MHLGRNTSAHLRERTTHLPHFDFQAMDRQSKERTMLHSDQQVSEKEQEDTQKNDTYLVETGFGDECAACHSGFFCQTPSHAGSMLSALRLSEPQLGAIGSRHPQVPPRGRFPVKILSTLVPDLAWQVSARKPSHLAVSESQTFLKTLGVIEVEDMIIIIVPHLQKSQNFEQCW